jgi:type II secretory pathway component PulK
MRKRGAALVVLIVSLAIAATLGVSLLRLAAIQRRSLEIHEWQAQAEWLAESGLERAAARLAADPAYHGETWTIPAEEEKGDRSVVLSGGEVTIRVEPVAGQEDRRRILIEADYGPGRARETRDTTITVSKGAKP